MLLVVAACVGVFAKEKDQPCRSECKTGGDISICKPAVVDSLLLPESHNLYVSLLTEGYFRLHKSKKCAEGKLVELDTRFVRQWWKIK